MTSNASGRFLLRLEPGLHAALRRAAAAAGTSLNDYCARKLAAPGVNPVEPAARAVERAASQASGALAGVVAFGSWARQQATAGSDIDLLIIVDADLELTRDLYRAWDDVPILWDGWRVEPHFVQLPTIGPRPSALWLEVAIDGVVLFERGFEVSTYLAWLRGLIATVRCAGGGHTANHTGWRPPNAESHTRTRSCAASCRQTSSTGGAV